MATRETDTQQTSNNLLGVATPNPDLVRVPDLTHEATELMLAEARHDAQDVVLERGPHQPFGNLFLPVERATEEFEQTFGRRPSIYEIAAGVASRPDLVDPVSRATLRWAGPGAPTVADSWFLTETVADWPRLAIERAAVAAALLECLQAWEEHLLRARFEAHMTRLEITHAVAFSQLRACLALVRGLDELGASPMQSDI